MSTEWETVIGLEVHCELRTATKLFCGCRNAFGDEPNTNVCPVCLGLPGSLPVLNRGAVELAMRIGLALDCEVRRSIFHRKNYFYPDMPKDYQVTQYDEPINVNGSLELPNGKRVGIERAHLEEDTGKTSHRGGVGGRIHDAAFSLVDYNRAGVPLVEIVSRPDLRSAEDAKAYVEELRAVLVAVGASDGKMEEGSLRVDANVSVNRAGDAYGTRCEIKNMNSLRSLGRAIDFEVARQIELVESGERVIQETRHWNEDSGSTSSMRSKEEAFDYRYFPEPDLVPVAPSAEWIESVRAALPPLPAQRRLRLAEAAGDVSSETVASVVVMGLDDLVLHAIAAGGDARIALNRAANEVAANPVGARTLDPGAFAKLVALEGGGKLTATQAKVVLSEMLASGGDPAEIASAKGFEALGDDAFAAVVDEVLAAHPEEARRLAEGDPKMRGFFVGKVMDATGKKADGKVVNRLLAEKSGETGKLG